MTSNFRFYIDFFFLNWLFFYISLYFTNSLFSLSYTHTVSICHSLPPSCVHLWQIVRKVVRRGKGSGEEGVQEVSLEGSLQDANELEVDAEQFMSYAILGRDSGKVGFWSTDSSLLACEALRHLWHPLLARRCT